ncbi:archaeosortase/exosortase family protein, partial [Candidatus Saccharibacteria bacterium]|nr:archaeosortase/exosortase family protein [Candidatus Saccharibacteria bacterium]
MKKNDIIKIGALIAVTLLAYIPTFIWMYDRWNEHDTYYSHGLLVPFISAFLVWMRRKELAEIKIAPSASGWAFFGAGIGIHLISALWRVYFSSGFSLLLVLPGIILLALGKEHLKKLLFPLLFLIFMIPLPLVAIANIS